MRWKLEEHDYQIVYKKGTLNSNADALSRVRQVATLREEGVEEEDRKEENGEKRRQQEKKRRWRRKKKKTGEKTHPLKE
jgi:hypothetical protein